MNPSALFQLAIDAMRRARAQSAPLREAHAQLFLELRSDVGRMDAAPQRASAAQHLAKVRSGGLMTVGRTEGRR